MHFHSIIIKQNSRARTCLESQNFWALAWTSVGGPMDPSTDYLSGTILMFFFLKKHPVPYESFIDEKWKVKYVNVLKKLYLLLPITCFFVLYAFNTVAVLGFISLTLLANMQTFGGTKINQSLYKKGPSVSLA